MNTGEMTQNISGLFREIVKGSPETGGFILNPKDPGLLSSLDHLSASEASQVHNGGASIAAHVDHVRYGLSLMNRWANGENPFEDSDWSVSWKKLNVSEAEWEQLRAQLRQEAEQWLSTLERPREVNEIELNGVLGSVAHVAYHFGAIRQIDRKIRGPGATPES